MKDRDLIYYVRRWEDVDRLEAQEIRDMAPETRMRLMLAAYRLALGLQLPLKAGDSERWAVTLRWCRLRSILGQENNLLQRRS